MFTVRHISPTGGETIGEATGVSWMPATPPDVEPSYPDTLWVTTPKGDVQSVNGGWAYVMNETGATVAKYHLGDANSAGMTHPLDSRFDNVVD